MRGPILFNNGSLLFVTINFRQVKNNFPIVWFQDAH
jgi:hypothetical protein